MKSGHVFVWVGAAVMAVGGGLLAGRAFHDSSVASERATLERARIANIERESRARAARRTRTLERIHVAIHKDGMFQGISVCPSEPLSNCLLWLGLGGRTLRWSAPQVVVPSRCEDLPMRASVECAAAGVRADAFVPTDWTCRMRNGYFGFNVNSFSIVDLRERQLDRGQVEMQCDEGQITGTLDVSTEEDP